MPDTREPILPDGLGDLLDLVKQKEGDERRLISAMRMVCYCLVPILVEKLAPKIDRDLFCAEGKELVLPLIREAAGQELRQYAISCKSTGSRMLEILTEETWLEMAQPTKSPDSGRLAASLIPHLERRLKLLRARQIRPMKSDI